MPGTVRLARMAGKGGKRTFGALAFTAMIFALLIVLLAPSAAVAAKPKHFVIATRQPTLITVLPPAPPAPPPFSRKANAAAGSIGAQVSQEFKRCGYARTNSNGRYVDALGTARHSPEWQKATLAMNNALTVCRNLREALRRQKDFLLDLVQNGRGQDVDAARIRLDSVSSELEALERFFSTETLKYRDLVNVGWGNPHCDEGPLTGFERPASLCAKPPAVPR
ncbi:MAG: hypothetical protein JWO81_1549 [Alphaproteobacteria bacterium]|nr:hypothetical protein [Alphaproteobacteria bacterium]